MAGHEPPGDVSRRDDAYLLLFQRLLQRFSEHARALADLATRLSEQARALERLDVLVTAQAAEPSELREASLVLLRFQAPAPAVDAPRPWWARLGRW